MDEPNTEPTQIPTVFYSFKENQPFKICLVCNKYLMDGADYIIEKAFRQYPGYKALDVIFDFALCMECALDMQKGISHESQQSIEGFMRNHFHSDRRLKMIQNHESPALLIDECLVSGKKRSECNEYQVFALCNGGHLNSALLPYMISGEVLHELSEILSVKTKEDMGGFFDKHFSPDPDLVGKDPRLIIF